MDLFAVRSRRSVLRLLALLSIMMLATSALAQSVLVADAVLTSGVLDRQPIDQLPQQLSKRPLYLWTRIEADAGALRELELKGMLPIRHRWWRTGGIIPTPERGGQLIDEIVLGVGKAEVIGRLNHELMERGFFDWRTWSMKEHITPGTWEVEIVYSDPASTPVACRRANSSQTIPCRFGIVVR